MGKITWKVGMCPDSPFALAKFLNKTGLEPGEFTVISQSGRYWVLYRKSHKEMTKKSLT